jgi:hypothetical protein
MATRTDHAEGPPPPRLGRAGRDEGRRVLGMRISALAETLAFLAAALAVDALLGGADRFAGVSPHPFWIAVLLVSVQYGTGEGLMAAALATAALLVGNLPEQGFNEDLYAWLLRATAQPLLWFVAAVVLGEIRDGQRRERDRLRQDLGEAREQARAIGEGYAQLARLKDSLEARVASQVRTVHAMYVASRAIERQDTGQVLAGVRALVRSVMGPRKFSLFLLNGRALEAAVGEGWSDEDGFSAEFGPSSPLFQAIAVEHQILVATDPAHGLALGAEGLLAGPLASAETGELFGMLKIEEMEFLDLNPASVQNFRVLCDWIGAAFANAQRFEEMQANPYFDPVRRLMPAPLFDLHRPMMVELAQRLGFDLSALYIGFDMPESGGASARIAAARVAARLADQLLRPTDLRFDCRRGGWDVAILLPGADPAAAAALARRFVAELAEEIANAGLQAGLRHTTEALHRSRGPRLLLPSPAA